MFKETNYKVILFWGLIFAITALFAVLFVIRFTETRIIESYDDIKRADLNLQLDITSGEGTYYVYMYSAKEDDNGKLIDSAKTDINKANDIFPTVLNYFNYVRRNERQHGEESDFYKIYGYNVNNREKDSNLLNLDIEISELPALVLVDATGSTPNIISTRTDANGIRKDLLAIMVE